MLKQLTLNNFTAVPWLATSQLAIAHKGTLKFSASKPNVIVGPNGAGKSALLTALAVRFLAYFTGQSSFDGNFAKHQDSDVWWSNVSRWGNDWTFMKGLELKTDNAPALYYRPNHVPGNEDGVTHAMMLGYFNEAKTYETATRHKSSGQANQAMLARLLAALAGKTLPAEYPYHNWSYGKDKLDLDARRFNCHGGNPMPWEYKAEVLKQLLVPAKDAVPLILMDEPEQSLDARAQAKLWQAIAGCDCTRMQVVVATHSIFPLLHRKAFNLIEAEAGFADQVLELNEGIAA